MQIGRKRKAGLLVFIFDKINFKTKAIVRDKERHYIMRKGRIQQEDITLVNIFAPNIGPPKYLKHILIKIKGEIDRNTVMVRDFNTPLTSMDRSSRQKNQQRDSSLK